MIVAMAGLPGTGKSTLARGLAHELGAVLLDKDPIRAALFPPDVVEYSTRQDDFVLGVMFQVAGYVLRDDPGRVVILDGRTFARAYQVAELVRVAEDLGTQLKIVECVCSEDTARRRLERDAAEGRHPAADRDFALYLRVQAYRERLAVAHLVVDTDQPLAACLRRCLDYIAGNDARQLAKESRCHDGG